MGKVSIHDVNKTPQGVVLKGFRKRSDSRRERKRREMKERIQIGN